MPCPASPVLEKSKSNLEEEMTADTIIDEIVEDVVKSSEPHVRTKVMAYCKVDKKQSFVDFIQNIIFHTLVKFQLMFYSKVIATNEVHVIRSGKIRIVKDRSIFVKENCFRMKQVFRIYYEYIHTISYNDKCVCVKLVDGSILNIFTENNEKLCALLGSNMNYHVRYNKINMDVAKYMPVKGK